MVLPKLNYKSMHHMLVYECVKQYNGTSPEYQNGDCYTDRIKMEYCNAISIGWAIGGQETYYYPMDTGYLRRILINVFNKRFLNFKL